MFNLYFEPDKIDDKKLIIEPRDIFYLNDVVDITEKVDVSQELIIRPMGALNWKSLEFHYSQDNDEFNKKVNLNDNKLYKNYSKFSDDPDAPEGAIECKIVVTTKITGKTTEKKTIKT
jgi:hypothetical protein